MWLDGKWGALSVYAPTDGDDPGVPGKIVGLEWQALLSTPVYVAVVTRGASTSTNRALRPAAAGYTKSWGVKSKI